MNIDSGSQDNSGVLTDTDSARPVGQLKEPDTGKKYPRKNTRRKNRSKPVEALDTENSILPAESSLVPAKKDLSGCPDASMAQFQKNDFPSKDFNGQGKSNKPHKYSQKKQANKTRPGSSEAIDSQVVPCVVEANAKLPLEGGSGKITKKIPKKKRSNFKISQEIKTAAPLVLINPLTIALELQKIPALPPALDKTAVKANKSDKGSAPKNKAKKDISKKLRMFISVIPGEQVEVGIAENETLLEYYLDMLHQRKLKGNIYKGIVHNIDVSLQAAFVDFGVGKNGFLQIDEVHPEYWQDQHVESSEKKRMPPIQKVLKPGQELLVQVVKEPSGNKGAFLTTWLSLAGRFLVLTPGQEQIGVSRKVEDANERARLRDLMNGIDPGKGLGVIVRTVGAGATKTTLKNDLQYLKRIWKEIRKKATEIQAPAIIYQEPGLSERSVRDYLIDEISEIWVDDEVEAGNIKKIVEMLFPRKKELVKIFSSESRTIWDNFKLKNQLDQIFSREVTLPSGGRLVFDQTEALMAIDINSGKISGKGNFEAMAFKTNMEAAEAIARQLRLRDIGGQVVIDFIEMKDKAHIQEVEKNIRQAMKNDRARHDIAKVSTFGLLELVRQRMGSSALAISMEQCQLCGGTGNRRNLEWRALQCLRELRYKIKNSNGEKLSYELSSDLGLYLLNFKRDALRKLEEEFGKILEIKLTH